MKKLLLLSLISFNSFCFSQSSVEYDALSLLDELKKELKSTLKKSNSELEVEKLKFRLELIDLRMEELTKLERAKQLKIDIMNQRERNRLVQEAERRENAIASAWNRSSTGRIDGRSWFDLTFEEQKHYRSQYLSYYNQK
jgi:hypothetical protein